MSSRFAQSGNELPGHASAAAVAVGGAAGSVTAAGTGTAVIEEVDVMVTVDDADAGEEIETIMVDESVDVPISVSGEDSSVPVTVVDESIPIDTDVEAEGTQDLFLISGAQLDAINILLVSHNKIKQATINKANTVRNEAEKIFLAPFLETLQPLLLAASNPLQSLAGNLGPVPVVEPALEVESPLEIVPHVKQVCFQSLCLFHSSCFHAVKSIPLEPT